MIEIGTLDRVTAIIGERGVGKSTLAIYDAREFQAQHGGFVIGHSPNGQIGHWPDVRFHDSLRSLDKALTSESSSMHFIASGAKPEQVIDYARELSRYLRREAHKRAGVPWSPNRPAPRGLMVPPVLVIIDEGTHTNQKRRSKRSTTDTPEGISVREQRELEKFLTSARHENIALTWLIQAPTSRAWVFMEQSNRFRVFRYLHEWGLNAVRAAISLTSETIYRIRSLPKFQYFEFDKDSPETAKFRKLPEI